MNVRSTLLTFGLALSTAAAAHAQTSTWTIDPAHSSATFTVRHMGVSTVHGSMVGLKGAVVLDEKNFSKSTVEATADTNTVDTQVEARNKHLKSGDFFDVAQFPVMTFKSTSVSQGKLTGDLTLHGVTKSITLDLDGPAPVQKNQKGGLISGFSATGKLSRKEFDFGQKTPASAAIGDDIKFTIDLEIDKQP